MTNTFVILVINLLKTQILILLYASTCLEHYVLITRRLKLYYTASGIITPVGAQVERFLSQPVHRTVTYSV